VADAGLKPSDIDAILPYVLGPTSDEMASQLGISDLRYSSIIKMGGATFVACLETAALLIHNNIARNVLVFCARNGRSGTRVAGRVSTIPGQSFRRDFESPYGFSVPGQWYAMIARRHMIEFGTTRQDAGHFAVAMRRHANLNPNAMMRDVPMSMDDYMSSKPVYDPFHLLDCCLESDGAGAFVVASAAQAKDGPHKPVYISGAAQAKPACSDDLCNRPDMFEIGLTKAAPRAFAMAGMNPSDMDGAMIYDCFSYVALLELEEAGFCRRGEAGDFVKGGRIELGGEFPINTHGGLLSEAHIAGINHVIEAVHQLRGACGPRQIPDAQRIAVTGWGDLGDGALAILRS
jgi:acetyl-CoA acetyltransferase